MAWPRCDTLTLGQRQPGEAQRPRGPAPGVESSPHTTWLCPRCPRRASRKEQLHKPLLLAGAQHQLAARAKAARTLLVLEAASRSFCKDQIYSQTLATSFPRAHGAVHPGGGRTP